MVLEMLLIKELWVKNKDGGIILKWELWISFLKIWDKKENKLFIVLKCRDF